MSTGEQIAAVNGVELCWEGFGDRADSAIVLLHGAGNSMLSWSDGFCERLASGGRLVVRHDSRDAGRSTSYEAGAPPYSSADVVADTAGLIDALGIAPAHVMGLSGGSVTAQLLALDYPDRVASLVLESSTPGLPGADASDLPGPTPEVAATFSDEGGEPDWADRDAVIEYLVEAERPFAGSGGFDEEAMREVAGRVVDRTHNVAAMVTNPFMIDTDPWRRRLREMRAPTLVIHGDDDPLFPLEHGQALAREIPDAELLVLEGVGHEYPPPRTWDTVVAAILSHTAR